MVSVSSRLCVLVHSAYEVQEGHLSLIAPTLVQWEVGVSYQGDITKIQARNLFCFTKMDDNGQETYLCSLLPGFWRISKGFC